MRFDGAATSCSLISGIRGLDSGMEAAALEIRNGLVAVWASRASAVRFASRGHHLQRDFTHPACVFHDNVATSKSATLSGLREKVVRRCGSMQCMRMCA